MAKLKATPKNFNQALAALNGNTTVRLGNNLLEAVELVVLNIQGCKCLLKFFGVAFNFAIVYSL